MKRRVNFVTRILMIVLVTCLLTACDQGGSHVTEEMPGPQDEEVLFSNLEKVVMGSWHGEKIEWLVLDKTEKGTLLLARHAIDRQVFEEHGQPFTWEASAMRAMLNDDFYNQAFTQEERQKILLTTLKNEDKEGGEMVSRAATQDYVFLLSYEELRKYCPSKLLMPFCSPTDYAIGKGAMNSDGTGCYWVLRGPIDIKERDKETDTFLPEVYSNSRMEYSPSGSGLGYYVKVNVRPAMWVNFDAEEEGSAGSEASSGSVTPVNTGEKIDYVIFKDTDREMTVSCGINLDNYLYEDSEGRKRFDTLRLIKDYGWKTYDGNGHPTDDPLEIVIVTYVDEAHGIETQLHFGAKYYKMRQLDGFDLEFYQVHQGDCFFPTTRFYSSARNEDQYSPNIRPGDRQIDYFVDIFGEDVYTDYDPVTDEPFKYGDLTYGMTYEELVLMVYAMERVTSEDGWGKDPFYDLGLPGKRTQGLFGSIAYFIWD